MHHLSAPSLALIVCLHLDSSVLSKALSLLGPHVPLGAAGAVVSPTA